MKQHPTVQDAVALIKEQIEKQPQFIKENLHSSTEQDLETLHSLISSLDAETANHLLEHLENLSEEEVELMLAKAILSTPTVTSVEPD